MRPFLVSRVRTSLTPCLVRREYPGTTGNPGNIVRSTDTENFLLFLTSLRAALAPGARISSCTTHAAFIGPNGSPLADVAAFGKVLDNIVVMNYDVWGGSSSRSSPPSDQKY